MSKRKPKLSIMMPIRNEGANIEIMLKVLSAVVRVPSEIIMVYDSPDDDSIQVVEGMKKRFPHVRLVHNKLGNGIANAIRTGVVQSRGDYILIFAVDEIGPVLAIEEMVSLMDEGCDLVSCTRYAYGGRRLGGSIIQGFLSRMGNRIFHLASGSVLTDSTTGIKMFRKSIFEKLTLKAAPVGWAIVFELAIKAQVANMKLGEVPVISIDRLYGGASSFTAVPWLREYLKWFFYGVRNKNTMMSEKPMIRIPHTKEK